MPGVLLYEKIFENGSESGSTGTGTFMLWKDKLTERINRPQTQGTVGIR
jgi:hypothetical protein